jgi:signal transduction histidine kinase
MRNRMFFLFSFMLVFTSCGELIDNLAEQNIVGSWNLQSIQDIKSGQETAISSSNTSLRILGNLQGNAVSFGDVGGPFNVYYQFNGDDGLQDGTFDVDLLTLELKFNNGQTLKRIINSVNDNQLIIQDTIGGLAKKLNFLRE